MFNGRFINALAMLVGTIIGAGIFGLPYVAAKSGFYLTIIYLIIIASVVTLLHLLYSEVVLRTQGKHRLVGYAEIYLGVWGKRIATVSAILGGYAGLLIYIILGGVFLFGFLGDFLGGNPRVYSVIIFFISLFFIAGGIKIISRIESFLSFLLIAAIFIFLAKGSFLVNASNFSFTADWSQFFLPYGVLLFALTGGSIIPELANVLDDDERRLKKTIILGTVIPVIIYFLFIAVVFGITGASTTPDAITGLKNIYGDGFVRIGALIGFLAVVTSFLAFGINLKKTFQYDYKFSGALSLVLALSVPFAIFLTGFDDFIRVIGFSGAVMGGIDGVLIILMYQKADRGGAGNRRPEYDIITSRPLEYLLIIMFALGIIYTILNP